MEVSNFTKKRAVVEKRVIPLDAFVETFFNAKDNVNKVKSEFKNQIELWLVIKDFKQNVRKIHFNIDSLDPYIEMKYNRKTLKRALL